MNCAILINTITQRNSGLCLSNLVEKLVFFRQNMMDGQNALK